MRKCKKCFLIKPIDMFGKVSRKLAVTYRHTCKKCCAKKQKEYEKKYKSNINYIIKKTEFLHDWYLKNKHKYVDRDQKYIDSICSQYAKKLLKRKYPNEYITDQMIFIKQSELAINRIKRIIKNQEND